ncbi:MULTISPECIES: SDR family oxidoreductase [Nostoc]|uniref:SDR family oxidoreductase n=1 Tax=Nostoc paludosum FACHB-159 TaxID=2692908 RepID=A0ABR8KDN2_9NOSO|nr:MULTISPECIES: SDR family oxidoreductase [Nostoc]MBD2680572.1 SDR family oxidoreductase [Nostoc sp. FACHB-857]MBD2736964.1 SDR family oxidoreductase [Nostoc paludosum FACHB-159]
MTGQFDGKVALVTGASSGIGRATAIAFARVGAKVVAASRRIAEGEETVRRIQEAGGEAIFVPADVSKAAEVEALVNKTVDTYGGLDCACNNAGRAIFGPLIEMPEEDWNQMFDVNLKGVWLCLKYEISTMLKHKGGAIVNVASIGGMIGAPGTAAYSATKGGVIALTRAAAIEYAKSGIRLNIISPGSIETDMFASVPTDLLAQVAAGHPIGRIGKPEEVAEAVVWLCSDLASFVTGHNMIIDGGYTAQ